MQNLEVSYLQVMIGIDCLVIEHNDMAPYGLMKTLTSEGKELMIAQDIFAFFLMITIKKELLLTK